MRYSQEFYTFPTFYFSSESWFVTKILVLLEKEHLNIFIILSFTSIELNMFEMKQSNWNISVLDISYTIYSLFTFFCYVNKAKIEETGEIESIPSEHGFDRNPSYRGISISITRI